MHKQVIVLQVQDPFHLVPHFRRCRCHIGFVYLPRDKDKEGTAGNPGPGRDRPWHKCDHRKRAAIAAVVLVLRQRKPCNNKLFAGKESEAMAGVVQGLG
jgi:hypothetical protein